ncbi:pentapeptide repeat-containing protein [Aphanothece sacrum]|uniref:Pentapeptide repeat protein n=1 Tax=Aphanothece sacrum FPU1 TaxID=1920663 RepID=A0A401IM57_APHSA|nr:pentapeptide repeat-containing protein [Aphanothece sacrum]GBF82337.1 pentapeptide repeat protein [Aphanothece sacrum FPU1]GBF84237.1 pentapeptide repeat protein [Aphanothece sacrum FPU3]
MKASQVLKLYDQGKRNFQGENLIGQSFKGKNLSNADFSGADIRGADFTNATLTKVKFCHAKAGQPPWWTRSLVIISWLMAALSGLFAGFASSFIESIFDSADATNQVAGCSALIILIIFFICSYYYGLKGGLEAVVLTFMAIAVIALIIAQSLPFSLVGAFILALVFTFHVMLAIAVAAGGTIVGTAAGAVAGTLTITRVFPLVVAIAMAIVVAEAEIFSRAISALGAISITLLSAYLGWRAMKDDPRDAWLRPLVTAFATIGGTSFYQANLTDADFSEATFKSTDLREANLTRTRFYQAKQLDLARVGKTILAESFVRDLLINPSSGYKQSYRKVNLRGANLDGANLNSANLKQANLTDASLRAANLEGANLSKVCAINTDLTGASLTGACLEDWKIDKTTQLDRVNCQYVFLLEKPNQYGSRKRRPNNSDRFFKLGEFEEVVYSTIIQ